MRRLLGLTVLCCGTAWAADGGPDAGALPPDSGPALGAMVQDTFQRLAESRLAEGIDHFEAKRFPEALASLRGAYELLRDSPPTSSAQVDRRTELAYRLALTYQTLGDHRRALIHYRETLSRAPKHTNASLQLASLLAEPDATDAALEAAARLLTNARQRAGNDGRIIGRQARLAARRGRFDEARRHYDSLLLRGAPTDALALEIAAFYGDFDRPDEALSWYRRVRGPGESLAKAVREIATLRAEREARRFGWTRPSTEIPQKARGMLERARGAQEAGRLGDAERLLEEAVRVAPSYSAAHAALGAVHLARGQVERAETAYLRAVALNGSDADAARQLGAFYESRRDWGQAVIFFERALKLRPHWTDLHRRMATCWRALGDRPRALHQVRLARRMVPEDAPDDALKALEEALSQGLPEAPPTTAESPPAESDARRLARANALFREGRPDAAMGIIRALPDRARSVPALTLEAAIMAETGQLDAAARALETALRFEPTNLVLETRLADVLMGLKKEKRALALLAEAEAAGGAEAKLMLAEFDLKRGADEGLVGDLARLFELRAARERLQWILDRPEVPMQTRARALMNGVEARLWRIYVVVSSVVLVLLLILILLLARRWGGVGLDALLRGAPEASGEIQALLSAIQHEVLKHNTLALVGLSDAPDGPAFAEQARYCHDALLGGQTTSAQDAAYGRLHSYLDQLQQIGRAHGLKLNPTHRDAAFRPLLRGFSVLQKIAPGLRRAGLSGRPSRRVRAGLRRAVRLLTQEAARGIRRHLSHLRHFRVDEAILEEVFARTSAEPALLMVRVGPLEIDDAAGVLPCRIAMPRRAFEDVLTNLMRNAIDASAQSGDEGTVLRVGVGLERTQDPITLVSRLALRVRDMAPATIDGAMIRQRVGERGLGLTADLVTRYDGAVDVEPAKAPWSKAVVVRLPCVEDEELGWSD